MKDKWNYSGLGMVQYGMLETYKKPCLWLDDVEGSVEDWGCGCAYARRFFHKSKYTGVDGSKNQYADICGVDLSTYTSDCDGILLRHVLDHNENWPDILRNAIASFRKRMAVVFFIEFGNETKVLSRSNDPKYYGVPDIQFKLDDILGAMGSLVLGSERVIGNGIYNDTIFYLKK